MSMKAIKEFFQGLPDDFDVTKVSTAAKDAADTAAKLAKDTQEAKEADDKRIADAAVKLAADNAAKEAADKAAADAAAKEEAAKLAAKEPSAREKELEAELAKLRDKDVVRDAEIFATAEIKAERAYPAEREALIALFTQAAKDDSATQTKVVFKNGDKTEEVSRVDALKSLYSVRKPHNLTKEELVGMGAGVLQTEKGDETDYVAEAEKQAREYAAKRNRNAAK